MKAIRFHGTEYVLTPGGSIATRKQLEDFTESFAHLFADGRIMRHGELIGHRDDIEILGDSDAEITEEGFLANACSPEAWPRFFKLLGRGDGR